MTTSVNPHAAALLLPISVLLGPGAAFAFNVALTTPSPALVGIILLSIFLPALCTYVVLIRSREDQSRMSGLPVVVVVACGVLIWLAIRNIDLAGSLDIAYTHKTMPAALLQIVGLVLGTITVVLVFASIWQQGTYRVGFALAAIIIFSTMLLGFAGILRAWGFLFAALPAAMIIRHAVYVRLLRKDELEPERNTAKKRNGFLQLSDEAKARHARNYDVGLLMIRFGIPAFLLLVAGTVVFAALFAPVPLIPLNDATREWVSASQVGAVGAYTYILINLGERAFRRDITSGIAQWAVVMAVLGPVVAGVAELVTNMKADESFGPKAFYFVAGLSPRWVASVVEEGVRRLWVGRGMDSDGPKLPLTSIRAIMRPVAERLEEEGIFDVHGLAMADPLKLLRNTNFDLRQIVDMMDEALLFHLAPHIAGKLREHGYTGAIDLAYLHDLDRRARDITQDKAELLGARLGLDAEVVGRMRDAATADDPTSRLQRLRASLAAVDAPIRDAIYAELREPGDIVKALAPKVELDPVRLQEMVTRLYHDEQVRLVWALYNLSGDALDGEGSFRP